jgi:hypothetical protein
MSFVLRHRTTRAFLTSANTTSPDLALADRFGSLVAAETIRETLEDFATAWDVEPAYGADWPAHFPGAWQHWPEAMRRDAGARLLAYWLATFGPADLVKTLVAARYAAAQRALPVGYGASAEYFWPLLVTILRFPRFPIDHTLADAADAPAVDHELTHCAIDGEANPCRETRNMGESVLREYDAVGDGG